MAGLPTVRLSSVVPSDRLSVALQGSTTAGLLSHNSGCAAAGRPGMTGTVAVKGHNSCALRLSCLLPEDNPLIRVRHDDGSVRRPEHPGLQAEIGLVARVDRKRDEP